MAKRGAVLGALVLVVAAACGGDGNGDGDDGGSTPTTATTATTVAPPTTTTTAPATGYTVQEGDTLSAIALRFGTTVEALVEANGIADPHLIQVGQVLQIPSGP